VLSALGVVLAAPEELVRAAGSGRPVTLAALIFALAVAGIIVIRLLVSLAGVSYRSRARRARHRTLVDLLDQAEQRREVPSDMVRVLDGPVPFAYCVPGRSPRVVLSGGTLQVLDRAQVDAVLAHESAHLRHHHDLVTESFTAFYRAVPRPLRSRVPLDAVHVLLEMVADDAARRRSGAGPLRAALERLSEADAQRRRLDRLTTDHRSVALAVVMTAVAIAILVLPTLILVVPWLDRAWDAWPL
jgi:hypothetical protein